VFISISCWWVHDSEWMYLSGNQGALPAFAAVGRIAGTRVAVRATAG
jgi:hypothetical protein